MKINIAIFFFVILLITGCQPGEKTESPTFGKIVIFSSESVAPMARQMVKKYENIYTDTKIDINISSSREAIVHLLNDSVEAVIVSRSLNEEEQNVVKNAKLNVHEHYIAQGGFVVLVHKNNPIDRLRTSQLDSICRNKIKYWKDLGWKNNSSSIQFFIPERNTDEYEFLINKFDIKTVLPNHFISLYSIDSVINEVSNKPNAIGLIGMNYYDTSFTKLKFLKISDNSEISDSLGVTGVYFSPAQAYVYRNQYPLRANIYIISNIKSYGLASGFISFATSVQGQKIVLNNHLVPAAMPVRIIQLNKEE